MPPPFVNWLFVVSLTPEKQTGKRVKIVCKDYKGKFNANWKVERGRENGGQDKPTSDNSPLASSSCWAGKPPTSIQLLIISTSSSSLLSGHAAPSSSHSSRKEEMVEKWRMGTCIKKKGDHLLTDLLWSRGYVTWTLFTKCLSFWFLLLHSS